MELIIYIPALIIILATLTVIVKAEAWWIRAFDFPRVQILILGVISLFLIISLGDPGSRMYLPAIILLIITLLVQIRHIVPFTPLKKTEVIRISSPDKENCISLLVSNVLQSNRESSKLISLVKEHKPDILITLESDVWWEGQLDTLGDDFPHHVKYPMDNLYGMHLYSRLPLLSPEVRFLVQEDIPSIHCEVELLSGEKIRMISLHPRPPAPQENDRSTERDAELVIAANLVGDKDIPTIVAGDFNDVAWSYTTTLFKKIGRLLDPRVGRGFYNTFHARWFFLRWPLDHVFHSRHFGLVSLKRLKDIGSDHFPIYAKLVLSEKADKIHEENSADIDERVEAEEKLVKAGIG